MSKQQAEIVLHHLRRLTSATAMGPEHDRQLLERFTQQREEAAFAALLDRYGAMVFRVCRRILHDAHEAEDAFQATFLVLARKAGAIRRHQSLGSWLYRVAYHVAIRARAGAARREELLAHVPHRAAVDPLAEVSGRELLQVLDEELQRLPEKYRAPLLLCYLEGHTQDEAARQLGWSPQVLRGRIDRGRAVLRWRLLRRGLSLSAVLVGGLLEQLPAPAMVPEQLIARTLHAAVGSFDRHAMAVSAHVAALVESGINALGAAKLKLVVSLVLALGILAAGLEAALLSFRAPQPETPAASRSAAPLPAQAKNEPRRDRYGDSLPPGAVARLGTLRFRAPAEIEALAFAPDSKTLAVSSYGSLFLFDAANGKRLRRLPSASPEWTPEKLIVFSPDGTRLAGLGHKIVGPSVLPVVRVWELDGERRSHEYDIGQWVLWLGWSVKNEPLAIRVEKGVLHLHELASGRSRRFECKEPRKNPAGTLSDNPAVACSPPGKALAVVDNKNVIHIWDTTTGRERCTLQPKGPYLYSMTFSPDGRRLLTDTPQTVQLWDVASNKVQYTIDVNENYSSPLFASNGKTLAIADSWQTIRFWDAATGRERGHTEGKGNIAASFALSPDGKWLVTAERHGSAFHLWDVATGRRKDEPVGHTNRPWGSAFAPDSRRVMTGGSSDGTFRLWDARTGELLMSLQQSGMARECAFSADGRTLFASWSSDSLGVYDANTGKRQHVLKLEDPDRPDTKQSVLSMHLSEDGKTLVSFSHYYAKNQAGPRYEDTLITGWDISTHKQLFRRRRPRINTWLALSADTRVLASPHHDGGSRIRERIPGKGPMRLEDAATGEPLLTFPALPGQTWPLAFSPDGRLLASNNFQRAEPDKDGKPGKEMRTLRLWEILTAAEVLSLPAADFNRVTFTRDNRLMAVAAPKQEIVVWDLRHGREWRRFKGFDAEVIDLTFSPDGRQLISGLSDSTLLIWDVGRRDTSTSKLDAERLTKVWADLAGADAPRAFRARGTLAAAPEETVLFLKEHLHPAQSADAEHLRHLLTDLASDEFTVREKARKALEELGDLAEPALRQTLANKPTLEVRRRVQALLEGLRGPVTLFETLRSLRAVAVLEDIATPPARRLLEELAQGASEARLTREAKASLKRLTRRSSP